MASANIVVVGAGVVGLTVALQLKRANSNYNITIVANHLPGDKSIDYTSPIAGANWHSFALQNELLLQKIDQEGYDEFMKLSQDPKLSIWQVDNVNYFTEHYQGERVPWFSKTVKDYEDFSESVLPDGITSGFKFKGVIISVPFYLQYLLLSNFDIGNQVKRVSKIKHIEDARKLHSSTNLADYVINCSGILVNDLQGFVDKSENFPIRGQVVHVRNNCEVATSVEGFTDFKDELLYIFPRKEGGTIIGGCFQENSKNSQEDPALTRRILNRALKYAPELVDPNFNNNPSDFDIVSVNVGLRPFRRDGPRIEKDTDKPWLIHAYGAGGGGYQSSYGISRIVLQLLQSTSKL